MGFTKSLYTLEQIRRDDIIKDSPIGEISGVLVRSTTRALLMLIKVVMVKIKVWLPKSQVIVPEPAVLNEAIAGDELTLLVPSWLAKTNKLTYKEVKNDQTMLY